ncbi:MAG: tetratricopeptide repeat protein [Bacteroidetes bacterium]|nr:tetratricopeptide repeat protein [Bacteroidota bacterium]
MKLPPKFQHLFSLATWCFIVIVFFVSPSKVRAQDQHEIDSLQKVLPTITVDSLKIKMLNTLSVYMVDMDPNKSINYAVEASKLSISKGMRRFEAKSYHNMGNGYYNLADYKTALSCYIKALRINDSLGNDSGILSASGAIGNVFLDMHQPDEAYKYFKQALAMSRKLKNKMGTASCLIALSNVYGEKHDQMQALDYCFQALKLFEEIGNQEAVATCYNNIASAYLKQNDLKKARFYITKAYDNYAKAGNVYGMALALNNIGDFFYQSGAYPASISYYKRGLEQALKIGANDKTLEAYRGLYKVYKKAGNYKDALFMNEFYQQLNDSIYNSESSKQIAEMQTRFDSEKKGREIDLLMKDKKIKNDELTRQRFISWAVAIGGGMVLLLALLAVRGYVQKRKINYQLAEKNNKIETAYNIIEDQHKDIKSSIRYALRLQEAILPTTAFSKIFAGTSFVLYQPKDIVSGDFYWIQEVEDKGTKKILFAAVDCTGHGVPGAFMSIVGHNLLNQAVKGHHKIKPSDILNEINIGLSETLRQTIEESTVKDGMDIALCSLHKTSQNSSVLQFSGANNPVWIIRNNANTELQEIKGDKFPIGIFLGEEMHQFNNHEVELFSGDTVYVFTDGFADQFGGNNGKKFKYKPLQQLILSIQHQSMEQQRETLAKTLTDWKGNLEQVDDVLIIGIRV